MEDVMYGVMFNAKTDMLSKEPPVNASKKLNASPVLLLKPLFEYVCYPHPGWEAVNQYRMTKIIA